MRATKKFTSLVFAIAVAFCVAGCGSKNNPPFLKDLVPATGRVTLKGQPLPGATVMFIPAASAAAGRDAMGITDASGAYVLSTLVPGVRPDKSRGALPGDYTVVISRIAMPDGGRMPEGITEEGEALAKGAKQFVPAPYTNPATSTLKAKAAGPKAENNFELEAPTNKK